MVGEPAMNRVFEQRERERLGNVGPTQWWGGLLDTGSNFAPVVDGILAGMYYIPKHPLQNWDEVGSMVNEA